MNLGKSKGHRTSVLLSAIYTSYINLFNRNTENQYPELLPNNNWFLVFIMFLREWKP